MQTSSKHAWRRREVSDHVVSHDNSRKTHIRKGAWWCCDHHHHHHDPSHFWLILMAASVRKSLLLLPSLHPPHQSPSPHPDWVSMREGSLAGDHECKWKSWHPSSLCVFDCRRYFSLYVFSSYVLCTLICFIISAFFLFLIAGCSTDVDVNDVKDGLFSILHWRWNFDIKSSSGVLGSILSSGCCLFGVFMFSLPLCEFHPGSLISFHLWKTRTGGELAMLENCAKVFSHPTFLLYIFFFQRARLACFFLCSFD